MLYWKPVYLVETTASDAGSLDGKRAKQDRMDDAEGGRIGADPERQGEAGGGEESRILRQPSKRVS